MTQFVNFPPNYAKSLVRALNDFQNFPGDNTPGPPHMGEGEGWGMGDGKERRERKKLVAVAAPGLLAPGNKGHFSRPPSFFFGGRTHGER